MTTDDPTTRLQQLFTEQDAELYIPLYSHLYHVIQQAIDTNKDGDDLGTAYYLGFAMGIFQALGWPLPNTFCMPPGMVIERLYYAAKHFSTPHFDSSVGRPMSGYELAPLRSFPDFALYGEVLEIITVEPLHLGNEDKESHKAYRLSRAGQALGFALGTGRADPETIESLKQAFFDTTLAFPESTT
jgi:hypothetical protein